MYKNIKPSCTFADLRHLCVRDSLLCVFICSKISINSNGWLGHLIGSVNCDVTGPLWRHQKAVSCLCWDKSISHARVYETRRSHYLGLVFNMGIPTPGKDDLYIETGPRQLKLSLPSVGKNTLKYWLLCDNRICNFGPKSTFHFHTNVFLCLVYFVLWNKRYIDKFIHHEHFYLCMCRYLK